MKRMGNLLGSIILLLFFASLVWGQKVLKLKPYDGTPSSYFIAQIKADTAANRGVLPDRVYELESGGIYLNTEQFNVAKGVTIRLVCNGPKKPIIYQFPTGTGSNPQNPPGNLFVLQGGNLEMKNIAVSGYFEPDYNMLDNLQGGIINTTQEGSSIIVDDCIFNNINGQHIRTGSATKVIKVTNTIFANMGFLGRSNLGAGKGLDLREASCDSLILVNNTFVNYQDRVIRHYNFSNPLAGTGGIQYCLIDHNTFVNGLGFHGLLSLGNVGKEVIIKNNLFYDAFALGEDSTDATRTAEWANTGETYANGNNRISWIFTAPNDTTKWTVKNNFYVISQEGQNFLTKYKFGEGSPLSLHIQQRLGAAAKTAFKKVNLKLKNIPKLMINMMEWYLDPNGGNKTKNTPSDKWKKNLHDMDRRTYKYFEDTLDCSYEKTSPAYYGSDRGFPVGDLNWYPDMKVRWEAGQTVDVKEENILVSDFVLEQNYPNPFNPTTNITYALPKTSNVTLVIYNALGQEVAKLVDNKLQSAGRYTITWDGKNRFGQNLSSGIYFYQLRTDEVAITKKMSLIK
ncbi:MAG: T9SS type A sorting domain-containing protein [Melioribacter sp.]|nr:T9SS type A sorting domain-containing protein [Melioribacter sp.]